MDLTAEVETESGERVPNPARAAEATEKPAAEAKPARTEKSARDLAGEGGDGEQGDQDDSETDTDTDRQRDASGRFVAEKGKEKGKDGQPSSSRRRGERRLQRLDRAFADRTRELHDIEARIAAKQKELGGDGTAATKETAPKPGSAAEKLKNFRARPTWSAYKDAGKKWDEYEKDLDAWHDERTDLRIEASQERYRATDTTERTREREERESRESAAAFTKRLDAVRAEHPDFDELRQASKDVDVGSFIAAAIRNIDKGAEMFYQFVQPQNVATVEDVADLLDEFEPDALFPLRVAVEDSADPARFLLALADPANEAELRKALAKPPRSAISACARLDERLTASVSARSSRPKPGSTAKPPLSHRAGSRSTGVGRSPSQKEPDTDEYLRRRRAGQSASEAIRA